MINIMCLMVMKVDLFRNSCSRVHMGTGKMHSLVPWRTHGLNLSVVARSSSTSVCLSAKRQSY